MQVVRGYLARKEVARISKDRLSKHDYDVRRESYHVHTLTSIRQRVSL